jgi:hypothetical protein
MVAIAVCLLIGSGHVLAADAPKKPVSLNKRLAKKVNCHVVAKPILDVIATLEAECEFIAVIGPELRKKNPKVTIELTNMTCSNVLLTLSRVVEAQCSRRDRLVSIGYTDFIKRVRRIRAPQTMENKMYAALIKRIDVDFANVKLRDATAVLQKTLKVNVLVMPSGDERDERVTLKMKKVRGVVALKYVALMAARRARVEKGIAVLDAPFGSKAAAGQAPEPEPEPEPEPDPEEVDEDF